MHAHAEMTLLNNFGFPLLRNRNKCKFLRFHSIFFSLSCVSRQLIDSFAVEIGTLKKEMVRKREPPAAREPDEAPVPFG